MAEPRQTNPFLMYTYKMDIPGHLGCITGSYQLKEESSETYCKQGKPATCHRAYIDPGVAGSGPGAQQPFPGGALAGLVS
jgi:hypothetical protein